MVVYTAQARAAAGSVAEIENRIAIAVSDTNAALDRSQVDTEIRLVYAQEVIYAESGSWQTDAPLLINDGDGQLDEVHALRNQYGADCVSLWVASLDAGGVGFFPDPSLTGIGASGFTIARQDGYNGLMLAHELGHNFYCAHDRPNATDVPYAEYSYGYVELGLAWHDIMAYPPNAGSELIPYFANPNVNWPGPDPPNPGPTGVPQGQPDPCDVARTMNELKYYVANFRPTSVSGLPSRLFVRGSAPAGGDGLSWTTAFNGLQDALCAAAGSQGAVQEIWVAAGTYTPDRGGGDRFATFRLVNGMTLYGGFDGTETLLSQRDPSVNVTVLSGDIGTPLHDLDNSVHIVDGSGTNPTAALDGFTITAGRADTGSDRDDGGAGLVNYPGGSPTIRNCVFTQNVAARYGAAVYNYPGASPTFIDCTFTDNTTLQVGWPAGGGAVFNYDQCSPSFQGCSFTGNTGNIGGAMANLFGSSPTLTDCVFQQNETLGENGEGGAIYNYGGCHPVLTDCTFDDNAADRGGGVYANADCDPFLTRCTFVGNTTLGDGGGFFGYSNVNSTLEDCTFQLNVGANGGGVALFLNSTPTLTGCTFEGNVAAEGGGLFHYDNVQSTVTRCVFRDNQANFSAAMANYYSSSPTITSCVFSRNTAVDAGGAMNNYENSSPLLVNCLLAGNSANFGGALENDFDSDAELVNCTVAGNSAAIAGGGLYNHISSPTLTNTILWSNTSAGTPEEQQMTSFDATPIINYCTIQGWTGAMGGAQNNDDDPQFLDADGPDNIFGTLDDNARLRIISPAVDSGDNAAVPAEVVDDLDQRPRIVAEAVDRGPYETGSAGIGDYDQDGDVDLADHAVFIDCLDGPNVSPSPTPPLTVLECLESFDSDVDGDVDLDDSAVVQHAFTGEV